MGPGRLTKVTDGRAFPCQPGDWCAVVLAAVVPLDRAGLGAHPRRAGADLWAFWMQLAAGEGEADTGAPVCPSTDTVGAGETNCSFIH